MFSNKIIHVKTVCTNVQKQHLTKLKQNDLLPGRCCEEELRNKV